MGQIAKVTEALRDLKISVNKIREDKKEAEIPDYACYAGRDGDRVYCWVEGAAGIRTYFTFRDKQGKVLVAANDVTVVTTQDGFASGDGPGKDVACVTVKHGYFTRTIPVQ